MIDLEPLYNISVNNLYFERYKKFIQQRYDRYIDVNEVYLEKHHILPKSLFKNFAKEPNNIIKLTAREHYISHWMLAKLTMSNKMWFSFNLMMRVIPNEKKNSSLYMYARKYIAQCVSEMNTGRPMTKENKELMSINTKDKVVVKDNNGNIFRTSVRNPKYLKGEYVYYRTGYRHKKETIMKMIKNNGVVNKNTFYNKKENRHYFLNCKPNGEEWEIGFGNDYKENMSKSISELIWYQNLITGESIRIHKDLLPPDGFTHGRFLLNNPGIEKANSLSSVVDLKNRKCSKVKEVQEYHAPQSGKSSENTIIFHFDNYIFTSVKRLVNYLELNEMFIDNHNLTSLEKLDNFRVKVKKKYYNKSKKQFDKSNEGKSLKELGIDYFRLLDYNYNLYIKENRIWHP